MLPALYIIWGASLVPRPLICTGVGLGLGPQLMGSKKSPSLVPRPLIQCVYRLLCAILKAIHAGVDLGLGPRLEVTAHWYEMQGTPSPSL